MPAWFRAMRPSHTTLVLAVARSLPIVAAAAPPGIDYSRQGHWQSALALPIEPYYPEDTTRLLVNGDVARSGDFLYLASGYFGVNIASVADPRHPRLVSHLDLGVRAHYLRVHGGLAFVGSDDDATALVVDISASSTSPGRSTT